MNNLLWAGTAFICLWLGLLVYRDIRFRSAGRLIDGVAHVSGHRETTDDDGFTIYYTRLTFTDHLGAVHEISRSFASRTPPLLGTKVPVRYPEGRPDLAREKDAGCTNIIFYTAGITMLVAFASAALLGFGSGLGR